MRPGPCLLVAALLASGAARGDEADPVVARVGAAELRASTVEARLAGMPAFQRRALGKPEEVRRHVVEEVLVRELLLSEESAQKGLATQPGVRHHIDDVLGRTLVGELGRQVEAEGVPDADIERYYTAHATEYQKPERIRIFRILVQDEALARKILAEVQGKAHGKDGLSTWNRLARDHSVDGSTKLRGGLLGFVAPNGHTDVPQLEADPALFAAAAKVRDGELVAEPVREDERFAVVWRRGALPAASRSLESERERIRGVLVRERIEARLADLVRDLTKAHVRDVDPSPLEKFEVPAAPETPGAPPRQPRLAASVDPIPRPTDQGLR